MRRFLQALALSLAVALTAAAPSRASPTVSIGETPGYAIGDVFTVPVRVSGAADLMAFQFDLSYDSSVLLALAFSDLGTDFEDAANAGGGTLTGITGFLFPGVLSGVADSIGGAVSGLSGSGTIVLLEFEAVAAGVSPLMLSGVFFDFAPVDEDSVVDGSITVPEPGTLVLVSLGLLFLARRRNSASS